MSMLDSRSNDYSRTPQAVLPTDGGGLRTLFRYASAVWDRISIVFLCIAVLCSVGLLYFLLTPRVYESQAEVLIRSVARDDRMLLSDPVIEDAVKRLEKDRSVDFSDFSADERADILRASILVRKPGGRPDILQVRCRRSNPEETAAILDAVVNSYRAYMGFVENVETAGDPRDPAKFAGRMRDELLVKKTAIEKRMVEARAELFEEMRLLQNGLDVSPDDVRPARGNRPQNRRKKNAAKEPGRLFVPDTDAAIANAQKNGKSPEQILRLRMLIQENRLLGMLRTLLEDFADNAADAKRNKAKAEVVLKPVVPTEPVSPRKISHVLFASVVFGTAIGLAIVFLLDAADDRYRSRAEIGGHLAIPVLGAIANPDTTTSKKTSGEFAESPHCFPTTLAIDALRPANPVVVLTRVNTYENRQRAAEGLAETFRLNGGRVLLIEAGGGPIRDGAADESGLARVLASSKSVADAFAETVQVVQAEIGSLDILIGGTSTELSPALLSTGRLSELLRLACERYDRRDAVMIATVALYLCIVLVYVPGLIYIANRNRLLRFPITSFTFLGLFVFNVAGSIFVTIPELTGRDDYARTQYNLLLVAQGLLFYLIAIPYVCFAKTPVRRFDVNPRVDRGLLFILMALIAAIITLYSVNVGAPPLFAIMQGGLNLPDIIRIRTNTIYGLPEFWLYNLGFTTIPLITAIYALAMRAFCPDALPCAKWIILACLCVNALPGGKGNVLDFCTALLIAYFLLSGYSHCKGSAAISGMLPRSATSVSKLKFSYSRMLLFLGAAFLPVLVMYKIYLGPTVGFGELLAQVVYRIVGVYSESIAAAVVYVEQRGALGGITLPTIRGLLTHDRILLDAEMHMYMFGAPGSVTLSGPAEGYLNFGWMGFFGMGIATFVSMIIVEEVLKNIRWNVLSISLLAFYSTLATKAAQISLFAVFVSLTYVSLVVLLFAIRKCLVIWQEYGQTIHARNPSTSY
eukprot:g21925.t1